MHRARMAALALTAGLGLVGGCSCLTNHPLFSRTHRGTDCGCETAGFPVDGPVLDGCCGGYGGPVVAGPEAGAPVVPSAPYYPEGTVPGAAPPAQERLVPQPQAQPMPAPATSSRRTPRVIFAD